MIKPDRLDRVLISALLLLGLLPAWLIGQRSPTLRDRARESGGEPLNIRSIGMPSGDPKSIDTLTEEADVVLVATLSRGKSYLSPSEYDVLTDFVITQPHLIAGDLAVTSVVPGVAIPLVVTMFGGETVLEGVSVRVTNDNFGPVRDGQYLLFLKRGQDPGRYHIYDRGIFAVESKSLKPLAREGEDIFRDLKDTPVSTVLARVERAAKQR